MTSNSRLDHFTSSDRTSQYPWMGPRTDLGFFGKRKSFVPAGNRTPDLSRRSLVTTPTTMSRIHRLCLGFDSSPFFRWLVVILAYEYTYEVSFHISGTGERHTRIVLHHTLLLNTAFVWLWRDTHQWATAFSFARFLDHTQRHTTVGGTPLEEWSARRRDLYLTTLKTDRYPYRRWDSNPQSQQASVHRPTP